jgi:hypothetical protein
MDAAMEGNTNRSTSAIVIENIVATTATIENDNTVETQEISEVESPMNPKIERRVENVVDTQDILEVELLRNQEIVALEGVRHCVSGYVTMRNGQRVWHVGIWEGCRGRPSSHGEPMENKKKRSSGPDLGS